VNALSVRQSTVPPLAGQPASPVDSGGELSGILR